MSGLPSRVLCWIGDRLGTTTGWFVTVALSIGVGFLPTESSTWWLSEMAIWATAFVLKAGNDDRKADKRQQDLQVKQNEAILATLRSIELTLDRNLR